MLFDCDVVESEIRIKTSEFGYSSENNAYTIYENLTAISGWLDNAKKYSEITLYVYDYNGKLIVEDGMHRIIGAAIAEIPNVVVEIVEVSEEEAQGIADKISEKYVDCDVELQFGGQPVYYYIISAE